MIRNPKQGGPRRAIVYATLLLVPIGVWFALMEVYVDHQPVAEQLQDRDSDGIVALPGGETLLEPGGSAGRDIFNWLGSHPQGSRLFQVGGNQFVGDTAALTAESVARLTRLAAMLNAHPDVKAAIVGPLARAERVRDTLLQFGVPANRVSAQARGASDPVAQGTNVAVRLSHDPSTSKD
jgi:outer membrane protein OmpA-like peptidoglycan-associated protein